MTLTPLLTAPLEIQIHAVTALLALATGPFALFTKRRGRGHRIVGYLWVVSMVVTCISSLFISGFGVIGPFSPLHGLALFALWGVFEAMRFVLTGRVAEHAQVMRNLYWRGLCLAGIFNFLPGRTMNRIFFNDTRELGYVVIALGLGLLAWHLLRSRSFGRVAA